MLDRSCKLQRSTLCARGVSALIPNTRPWCSCARIARSAGRGVIAHNRLLLRAGERHIIATLYQVTTDLVAHDEAALSESAWNRLDLKDGDTIAISHPDPLESLSHVRSRIYGNGLSKGALTAIITDVVDGKYSDIHLSSFITACAARPLDHDEVLALTKAMVDTGDQLSWSADIRLDKHSVGGLPGKRTTPIIVPIIAALGLTMPKTSSRAITSPAGTADTMETMAPVELAAADIHRVVEQESGCIVWGGAIKLSPADDLLIRIERALDLDSEGQMIASVLSRKRSPPARHILSSIFQWVLQQRFAANRPPTLYPPGSWPLPTRSELRPRSLQEMALSRSAGALGQRWKPTTF